MSDASNEHSIRQTLNAGAHRFDGTVSIIVSEDRMEARADFVPPIGNGEVLKTEAVAQLLNQLGIVSGVDWDAIEKTVLDCNLDRRILRGVLVAKGQPPVEAIPEYFEIDPAFRKWPQMPDGDVPRIDFREISPFVLVHKDDVLAVKHPRVEGKNGSDVMGNETPATAKKVDSATNGPNTRIIDNERIVATCDGRLVLKGTELVVEETLEIKGGVGYRTGHIIFPGDVVIDGPVADGFKVYAGGSIVSKQTFDATDVVTKKDLIVAGGLIGRGPASIRVGSTLRAKFIQNCKVAARGPIVVGSAVVNSRIYTLQSLDLGDKGRLVGGEVFAVKGVRAASIGNAAGRSTKVHCGIDFTVQQDLDRSNERIRIISLKLNQLKEMIAAHPEDPKRETLLEAQRRMETELAKIASHVSALLGKLDADEGACVEVLGEISKGTLIEICHVAFFLDKPMKKIRFRLDKANGRLVSESL